MDSELRGAVDEMLKGVDDRLTNHTNVINDQLSNHTKEIDQRFSKFQTEVRNDLKTHFENMEDLVKRAAEGYGATLERIERELKSHKTDCDTRFEDHNAVLDNHKQRIVALEGNSKPSGPTQQ